MREKIIKALERATGQKGIHLEKPESEDNGDYASNIAMQIASRQKNKKTKKQKNSRELAESIVEKLKKDKKLMEVVEKIEVAGLTDGASAKAVPGFINFWLTRPGLVSNITKILMDTDRYGSSEFGKGKTVLVEYSSPNIAKQFSVGHMRSTIIGQSLRNIYDFLGYKTIGENHFGDWGTQFGMIIAQIIRKNINQKNLKVSDYQKLYIEFNKEIENNPDLRNKARYWFKQLEDGDEKAKAIWKAAVDTSLKEFEKIYDYLQVDIENSHGESFYEDKMQEVVDEVRNKGLSKKSEGAEIIEIEGMSPAMLLKNDGGTTYFTRDLAALKYRIKTWSPEIFIYEVGVEQTLHFKQVFAAAKALGWIKKEKLVHIGHGLFRFKGKKMASRKGTDVDLQSVLEESVKKARKIIEKSETGRGLSTGEKKDISEAVGIGAIKYYDLMHNPKSDIDFSWEDVFLLEGNSGPYLQYTFARTQSVLRKAELKNKGSEKLKNKSHSGAKQSEAIESLRSYFELKRKTRFTYQPLASRMTFNKEELALMRSFVHFPDVVQEAAQKYSPNLICNYLYDLAQKFNTFYNAHRIIDGDIQNAKRKTKDISHISYFRIALTEATGQVLKNGLCLLGIQAPEKM